MLKRLIVLLGLLAGASTTATDLPYTPSSAPFVQGPPSDLHAITVQTMSEAIDKALDKPGFLIALKPGATQPGS